MGGGLLHDLDRDTRGDRTAPSRRRCPPGERAGELVERIVAADILPHRDEAGPGPEARRHARAPVRGSAAAAWRERLTAWTISAAGKREPVAGDGRVTARIAASMDSMPQRPQPSGPASRRRRARSAYGPVLSRIGVDALAGVLDLDRLDLAQAPPMMPSVRLKPTAKSSRSAGLAIITAWVVPSIGKRDRRLLGHLRRRRSIADASGSAREAAAGAGPAARSAPSRLLGGLQPSRCGGCARPCASYSSCQSVGPLDGDTCTAVTLYSGQLVAQSE